MTTLAYHAYYFSTPPTIPQLNHLLPNIRKTYLNPNLTQAPFKYKFICLNKIWAGSSENRLIGSNWILVKIWWKQGAWWTVANNRYDLKYILLTGHSDLGREFQIWNKPEEFMPLSALTIDKAVYTCCHLNVNVNHINLDRTIIKRKLKPYKI